MDEMTKENEAIRSKLRSTLNTFYHETQHEITNLNQLISSKNGIIADLRARLGKYEKTVVMEGEEPYIVGPSKSLIESLCKEVCKLKQKLKEPETDAAQKLETSKPEIQRLQEKLKEKEQELETIRNRPEQEKEKEIQRLRSMLADRDQTQATRDVLCNSLAEEAEQLRAQLGATVHVCQELLGRLEKEKTKSTKPDQKAQVNETTVSSEVSHLNDVINKLQEENNQLKKRVAYVENLNSKWQKYDSSREEYVRGLCQKLKEFNGLVSSSPNLTQMSAADGTTLFQQEIAWLNGLLEEKMMECERLSRENDENTKKDQERIQMLEQQVLAYIEDFKSERADRERAQGKILDLQDQIGRLQLQIRTQNVQEASSTRGPKKPHAGLKKTPHRPTVVAEPLLRNSPPEANSKRTISNAVPQAAGELQCPLCFTTYDDEHIDEYLNHWDECAKL